ncbi:ATP synthase delta/epsilon chain alpha-helix domain-containing protein [Oceanirhabdus sp. W0125-5]|uniref:ATP synthase delta/epsilon chain alpha-helix domain-containing protein n=1 Tax=Oceanirhabdus sp. W0125-5 TaxID=2999116 RepID=UPI0022F31A12|nr:ATP synthase delta/epsilon chain alpha-helix domain-containing protein [Oceanirhabdus sp. W0125-5]WBW98495.1 ATP synthase delta/epsilon chain alpha-helix domain-containing protein [Oceanirhabdus sp. W0125-5]
MKEFNIKIISTKGTFLEDKIEEIKLKDISGKFSILSNHEARVVFIVPCKGEIIRKGAREAFFVSFGILNIDENGDVLITCEACEWKSDIDIKRAKESKERALNRIDKNKEGIDIQRAEKALMRAVARIESVS